MTLSLVRLIIYVRDMPLLKHFYGEYFDLPVIEEIKGEWVVFQAGAIELALHLAGEKYRGKQIATSAGHSNQTTDASWSDGAGPTTKFVFVIESDLKAHHEKLLAASVRLGTIKRYAGFAYQMYDGHDPEGNIFQVMQFDREKPSGAA